MSDIIKILWVEDNIGDILLIKEAFNEAGVNFDLNVLNDGADASDFLFYRGKYSKAVRPNLVILDLNLPKKSGREIIVEMKNDPQLNQMPLIVLTSSAHDQHVLDGYAPDRCIYLTKPSSFIALVEMSKKIQNFWQTLNTK